MSKRGKNKKRRYKEVSKRDTLREVAPDRARPIKRDYIKNKISKARESLLNRLNIELGKPYYEIEDNRRINEIPRKVDARPAKVIVKSVKKGKLRPDFNRDAAYFTDPKKTIVCRRRKERKQVLFALKKTGRGSGGGKKRLNENSFIRCTRR